MEAGDHSFLILIGYRQTQPTDVVEQWQVYYEDIGLNSAIYGRALDMIVSTFHLDEASLYWTHRWKSVLLDS